MLIKFLEKKVKKGNNITHKNGESTYTAKGLYCIILEFCRNDQIKKLKNQRVEKLLEKKDLRVEIISIRYYEL